MRRNDVKLAFHDANTDTDFLASMLAGMSARKSCRLHLTTPTSSPTSSRGFSRECQRVGRVGEDPREDVGVGVVECGLYALHDEMKRDYRR